MNTTYKYVTSFDKIDKLFSLMSSKKLIAFDTETSSLKFNDGEILCFSFSWKSGTGIVLPLVGQHLENI